MTPMPSTTFDDESAVDVVIHVDDGDGDGDDGCSREIMNETSKGQTEEGADDEENEDEEEDPFASLGDDCLTSERPASSSVATSQRVRKERQWGIPNFQEQIDKNITTFTLRRLDQNCERDGGDNPNGNSKINDGVTVQLEHRKHSTGSDLWDSALVMAHAFPRIQFWQQLLSPNPSSPPITIDVEAELRRTAIIELGSGTGALGLYCHKCLHAQHVIMTDLKPNLELIEDNVALNGLSCSATDAICAVPLDWTDDDSPALVEQQLRRSCQGTQQQKTILIVGTDIFLPFASDLLRPLAKTILKLLRTTESFVMNDSDDGGNVMAIVCYEERFDCSAFFEAAASLRLKVEFMPNAVLHPKYQDPGRIHVLKIRMER